MNTLYKAQAITHLKNNLNFAVTHIAVNLNNLDVIKWMLKLNK
jgi:hypothetical protein